VLAGLAIVLFGLAAPPVGANYGRVSARITCDRTVTWTASASSEGSDEDRTNRRVLVERRATRGQEPLEEWTPAGPEGSFDPAGGFEFSGSFRLPEGADSVDLRVTPLEPWGTRADGDPPGAPRFSRAELPEGCDQQPVVATVTGDCAAGGALVELRNTGEHPHAATVASDGVPVREVRLEPAGTAELIVPLLEGRPSDVRVSSGDFVVAEATVEPDCGLDGPAAVVLERCAARQAVVHARRAARPRRRSRSGSATRSCTGRPCHPSGSSSAPSSCRLRARSPSPWSWTGPRWRPAPSAGATDRSRAP